MSFTQGGEKLERAKQWQEPNWDVILNVTDSALLLIVDAERRNI